MTPYADLKVAINPVGWKAPTAFVIRRGGRLTAGMAPSTEVLAYQAALSGILRPMWDDLGVETVTTECRLDLFFSRQLITYVSNESGRNITKHRQDLTNLRKSTEDALQPWLVKNDVLITSGWTEIVEQTKTADPFIRLTLYVPGATS